MSRERLPSPYRLDTTPATTTARNDDDARNNEAENDDACNDDGWNDSGRNDNNGNDDDGNDGGNSDDGNDDAIGDGDDLVVLQLVSTSPSAGIESFGGRGARPVRGRRAWPWHLRGAVLHGGG